MSIDTSVGRVDGVRVSIDTSVQVSGQGSAFSPRSSSGVAVGTRVRVNPTFNNKSPVRRPCGCGSSSVSRVAAGLSSPPRQSSGSGVGAVSV